jgi:uncharacterized membrane protein
MDFALFSMQGLLFFLRWFHIFFGVIWIGHLYYFNFVQGAFFAETDASTKSNAIQKLVPRALWWFRYGALGTWLTGVILVTGLYHQIPGYFSTSRGELILVGMTMATLMFLNVWLIIWPKQKIVIQNAVDTAAGKPANPASAGAGARALVASRTNTLFSIPVLFFMASAVHLPLAVNPETSKLALIAVLAVIIGAIELNAIKGKTGPMTSVKGVIHCGFALTAVLYVVMELLSK